MENLEELYRQMDKVREYGSVNMIDRNGVMHAANRLHCYALVTFLAEMQGTGTRSSVDGRQKYMAFLNGFGDWLSLA